MAVLLSFLLGAFSVIFGELFLAMQFVDEARGTVQEYRAGFEEGFGAFGAAIDNFLN